jgi:hypothetical protein
MAFLPGKAAVVAAKIRRANMRNTLSVADCLQLISTVDAVEVLEAFKRIPDQFRGFTFFGADDRWLYIKSGNPNLCENCLDYEGEVFYGDSIGFEFPYLRIID